WLKIVKKHPVTAIEAFANSNYRLFSSERCGYLFYVNLIEKDQGEHNWYGITENAYGRTIREEFEPLGVYASQLPLVGLTLSGGLYIWILAFFFVYYWAKKRYDNFAIMAVFVLWVGTMMLGPIIYMRYVLPAVMAIPLYACILYGKCEISTDKMNSDGR
nr:DUF6020 family protein [Eubacterium sp.]